MSLTYHNQHLAWQQRVSKEITSVSNYHRSYDNFYSSGRSKRSRTTPKRTELESRPLTGFTETPLNNMNVYAEVRGKYARPLPHLNQFDLSEKLAPKTNSVVARPATSGSLVRAGTVQKPQGKPQREVDEVSQVSRRSIAKEDTKSHRSGRRSVPAESKREVRREVVQPPVVDKLDVEAEQAEESQAEMPQEDIQEFENRSEVSWVTTSSQRQYIQELEDMLKQERMRRIQAEKALEGISNK